MRAMGDEELVEGIEKGTRIRVKSPVTVYHSPKLGDFNLEGQEGEVMEVKIASQLASLPSLYCPAQWLNGACIASPFTCLATQHAHAIA